MTLFDQDKTDLIESYADMTISELCGLEDVLKDIPVCRSANTANTIRDYFMIQKFLAFRKKFYDGKADQKEVQRRKLAAEKKESWICPEIELLLIRIAHISDKRNVEILCSIYQKYLNRECSWEMFEEVSLILERFFYQDAEQLKALYRRHIKLQKKQENSVIATMSESNHCDRLVALGLVWQKYTAVLNGGINVEYCLTNAGLILAGVL